MSARKTWLTVVFYAIAMAWVESAVVVYLRTLLDRVQPFQANPLPNLASFGTTEIIREAATMLMLLTVGCLAGNTARKRIGYSLLAFGIWDIFYYVFLRVICGWPRGLLDWDILFLIPLPWWGPVLSPVMIATLMVLWGTAVTQFRVDKARISALSLGLCAAGTILSLYAFMRDAIAVLPGGEKAVRAVLPSRFAWELFIPAATLMSAPLLELFRRRGTSGSRTIDAGSSLAGAKV